MNKRNKPKRNKQTSNQEIESPVGQSSIINPLEKEPPSNRSEENTDGEKDKSKSNRGLFWINIAMLLAFIGVNSWLITNSNRNAKIQLRAYVEVDEIVFKQFLVGKPLNLIIAFQNMGQTPAYNLKVQIGIWPSGTEITEEAWRNLKFFKKEGISLGLKTDYTCEIYSKYIVTLTDSLAWIKDERPLKCFGKIFYNDVFGDSHYGEFSSIYNHKIKKFWLREGHNTQY